MKVACCVLHIIYCLYLWHWTFLHIYWPYIFSVGKFHVLAHFSLRGIISFISKHYLCNQDFDLLTICPLQICDLQCFITFCTQYFLFLIWEFSVFFRWMLLIIFHRWVNRRLREKFYKWFIFYMNSLTQKLIVFFILQISWFLHI